MDGPAVHRQTASVAVPPSSTPICTKWIQRFQPWNRLHSGFLVCRGCSSTGPIGFTQSHTLSYFSTACIKSCFYCVASATHWIQGSSSLTELARCVSDVRCAARASTSFRIMVMQTSFTVTTTHEWPRRGVWRFGFWVHTHTDETRLGLASNKARKEAAKSQNIIYDGTILQMARSAPVSTAFNHNFC